MRRDARTGEYIADPGDEVRFRDISVKWRKSDGRVTVSSEGGGIIVVIPGASNTIDVEVRHG